MTVSSPTVGHVRLVLDALEERRARTKAGVDVASSAVGMAAQDFGRDSVQHTLSLRMQQLSHDYAKLEDAMLADLRDLLARAEREAGSG